MNNISNRSCREKLVQMDKNCGTFGPYLIHLMVRKGFETSNVKFSDPLLESLGCIHRSAEENPLRLQIQWLQLRNPSFNIRRVVKQLRPLDDITVCGCYNA